MTESSARSSFSGKTGFLLACVGASIGLGNIWRFPILAANYGGGAFIFVYFVLALTLGAILVVTEMAIGRKTGKSMTALFFQYAGKHKWIGILCFLLPLILISYYLVVGGWVMKYFSLFASGDIYNLGSSYFSEFSDFKMAGLFNNPIFWFVIFTFVTMFISAFRVDKGLERMNKIMMPVLFILIIVMAAYVVSQDNFREGVRYYIVPKLSNITIDTLFAAMSQIFYSLSLAMGILVTFGSYTKKDVIWENPH